MQNTKMKSNNNRNSNTVCAAGLWECVAGQGKGGGEQAKVMKFVLGLFSFLCEFLLRRRRLRKGKERDRCRQREKKTEIAGEKKNKNMQMVSKLRCVRSSFMKREWEGGEGKGRVENRQHDNRIVEKTQKKRRMSKYALK